MPHALTAGMRTPDRRAVLGSQTAGAGAVCCTQLYSGAPHGTETVHVHLQQERGHQIAALC
jgi:hypothetical protein